MRTSWFSPRVVAGFLLLLALAGVLVWLALRLSGAQPQPAALTLAEDSAPDSPLPPAPPATVAPTTEIIVITPPPDGSVILLPPVTPGQIYAFPSPTPFPTPTPVPTPTRLPGLVVKPYPTLTLARSAEGQLLIRSEAKVWQALPVDVEGRAAGELQPPGFPQEKEVVNVSLSPDGKYWVLLLPGEPGGRPDVYNNETHAMKPLLPQYPSVTGDFFGWHPNSRQVLFWSLDVALWLANVETGQAIPLAVFDGPMQAAALSPDGQYVIYIARSNTSRRSIWMVSTAGSDARVLADIDGGGRVFGWSPDGKYVLMMATPQLGSSEQAAATLQKSHGLWLFNPQDNSFLPLALPDLNGYGLEPVWSPDGKWVAGTGPPDVDSTESLIDDGVCRKDRFFSQECLFQNANVYIENIQTGEVRHIGRGAYPTWSPDGARLAYVAREGGKSVVNVVDVANPTGGGSPVATLDGSIYALRWTPQ